MQFNFTAEQQLLQDSVARFIADEYAFEKRRELASVGAQALRANWRTFAANGWLAAALPEEYGGFGGSVLETVIIAQQFGRGLVIEPYLGCAVLAAQTLLAAGTQQQRGEWLPSICDGSRQVALAYSEPMARGMPHIVTSCAARHASGYVIKGRKTLALGADADAYIVSARTAGRSDEHDGISLFVIPADAEGLATTVVPLHDGSFAAELTLDAVHVDATLGDAGRGLQAIQEGLAHGILALGAELIGAMERTIEITSEYLRSRKQFGVAIASFQSLQHRMADMAAEMELARSMLFTALDSFTNDDTARRNEVLSAAKAFITNAARNVCGQGIQLHGGIGMTEEYVVGHYFKRAVVADVLLGSSASHEAVFMNALQRRVANPTTCEVLS